MVQPTIKMTPSTFSETQVTKGPTPKKWAQRHVSWATLESAKLTPNAYHHGFVP